MTDSGTTTESSPLVVRLPLELRTALEKEAARLQLPVSAVVRRILTAELLPQVAVKDVSPVMVEHLRRQISRIVTGLLIVFTTVGTWTLGTVAVL